MTASPGSDEWWPEVGIDPVAVVLPATPERPQAGGSTGYTLRAYRPADQVAPTEVDATSADDPLRALAGIRPPEADADGAGSPEEPEAEPGERPGQRPEEPEEAPAAVGAEEDVPLFLSHRGRLLLFGSPDALVEFVRSDAEHDLHQLDSWATMANRIRPADVAPDEGDTYRLDQVVANLREGPDGWDRSLVASAGEFARDVGYALRLAPVIDAMAPGTPLDELDEALRAADRGGVGGLLARRRLRRFGTQQASLGWRNVIGKIAGVVDWRD